MMYTIKIVIFKFEKSLSVIKRFNLDKIVISPPCNTDLKADEANTFDIEGSNRASYSFSNFNFKYIFKSVVSQFLRNG